jgi:hypothetical protein
MKKLITGLLSIIIGISGCQMTIDEEVIQLNNYSEKLREVVSADKKDKFELFAAQKLGGPFQIVIYKTDKTEIIIYADKNEDGIYDFKDKVIIPKKLYLTPLPLKPRKNSLDRSSI